MLFIEVANSGRAGCSIISTSKHAISTCTTSKPTVFIASATKDASSSENSDSDYAVADADTPVISLQQQHGGRKRHALHFGVEEEQQLDSVNRKIQTCLRVSAVNVPLDTPPDNPGAGDMTQQLKVIAPNIQQLMESTRQITAHQAAMLKELRKHSN